MIPIFAQDFLPPSGMLSWVACLAFGVFFLDRALSLYRKAQPRPPMDEQLKHIEKKIAASEDKIMARLGDQDTKAEARVTKIHERINVHSDRIGYIEGKIGIRNVS